MLCATPSHLTRLSRLGRADDDLPVTRGTNLVHIASGAGQRCQLQSLRFESRGNLAGSCCPGGCRLRLRPTGRFGRRLVLQCRRRCVHGRCRIRSPGFGSRLRCLLHVVAVSAAGGCRRVQRSWNSGCPVCRVCGLPRVCRRRGISPRSASLLHILHMN